jgi:hypothetical protein
MPDRRRGAERRALRHAEETRVDEGIGEHELQRRARRAERGSQQQGAQSPREAYEQYDA